MFVFLSGLAVASRTYHVKQLMGRRVTRPSVWKLFLWPLFGVPKWNIKLQNGGSIKDSDKVVKYIPESETWRIIWVQDSQRVGVTKETDNKLINRVYFFDNDWTKNPEVPEQVKGEAAAFAELKKLAWVNAFKKE